MAHYRSPPVVGVLGHNELVRLHLSDEQTAQIIAFLNTLSGPAPEH